MGVNYLQQFESLELNDQEDVEWHYIGKLQTKKIAKIVKNFDLIHSVDNFNSLIKINSAAEKLNKTQNLLLQVNLSKEDTKSGFYLEEIDQVIAQFEDLNSVKLCGFMTMPPQEDGELYFRSLQELFNRCKLSFSQTPNVELKYLSMGTSGDYLHALKYGATHIRLGTVLLGERE